VGQEVGLAVAEHDLRLPVGDQLGEAVAYGGHDWGASQPGDTMSRSETHIRRAGSWVRNGSRLYWLI
jgi:hypothetical protein